MNITELFKIMKPDCKVYSFGYSNNPDSSYRAKWELSECVFVVDGEKVSFYTIKGYPPTAKQFIRMVWAISKRSINIHKYTRRTRRSYFERYFEAREIPYFGRSDISAIKSTINLTATSISISTLVEARWIEDTNDDIHMHNCTCRHNTIIHLDDNRIKNITDAYIGDVIEIVNYLYDEDASFDFDCSGVVAYFNIIPDDLKIVGVKWKK